MLEKNDPQSSYLLSAWQRICLIMKGEFAPYLQQIMPSILSQASLKTTAGVQGMGEGDLEEVMDELNKDTKQKQGVMNDEIEEKNTALEMLSVFLEECPAACANFIEPVSKVVLELVNFSGSD